MWIAHIVGEKCYIRVKPRIETGHRILSPVTLSRPIGRICSSFGRKRDYGLINNYRDLPINSIRIAYSASCTVWKSVS